MPGRRQADDDPTDPSGGKVSLGQRLKAAMLKPVQPGAEPASQTSDGPPTVEELESRVRFADDQERLIGLTAAPLAAILGLLIPPRLNLGESLRHELTAVMLVLSVVMMITALYRKRLYLGMVTALYGLTVFNLHWWGFGVPYVLIGAWLLVRAYRAQRSLREATGDTRGRGGGAGNAGPPRPSRRYTPPSSTKRSISPDPKDERRAG
jgi:hypothetical protein